jgi:hypothetical protein
MPAKVDLKKEHKELYTATRKVKQVRAGKATFLAVDGQGRPGNDRFQQAINKLYALAYTTKFTLLKEGGLDFGVCNLECLWLDDPTTPIDKWRWRLMVRIPDQLKAKELNRMRKAIAESKGLDTSDVKRLTWAEGPAVQVMHVGPYDQVSATYRRLGEWAEEHGLLPTGPGHEIYISDPRRTAPERLKTIVRMPVRKKK